MISLAIGAVIGGEGSGASASADRAGGPADPSPAVSTLSGAHPSRVQLSRRKGWRMPANTVSVARPGRWGNPYMVERVAGLLWDPVTTAWKERWELRCKHWLRGTIYPSKEAAVAVAIASFRDEVAPYLKTDELHGKNLACWCPLYAPCHADVLLELANAPAIDARSGETAGLDAAGTKARSEGGAQ